MTLEFLIVLMVLIAAAFAFVLFRAFDPRRKQTHEHDSHLPFEGHESGDP